MVKKLALAAVCLSYLCGNAMAQDAKTVDRERAESVGRSDKSITYSGSAKDVAFQQCGANATADDLPGHARPDAADHELRSRDRPRGAHDAPHGRHEQHRAPAARRRWRPERSSSRSRRNRRISRSPGRQSLDLYLTPWGFLKGAAANNATASREQRRRQELHGVELEPRGQGAVRQELRDQRLRERPESHRARRDVDRREHHGRHAHRRHLFRLEGLRRSHGAREDRADARRMAVLRSRRDGGQGESVRPRVARARAGAASGRPGRRSSRRRAARARSSRPKSSATASTGSRPAPAATTRWSSSSRTTS